MSQPYIGEIRMFAGNFAPAGWELCQGQLLSISENETLFTIIGTTYGGDGQSTFAVPDLRGRLPIHQGSGAGLSTRQIGENGGTETSSLSVNQIPNHNHAVVATPQAVSSVGNDPSPAGNHWARAGGERGYGDTANVTMAADLLSTPTVGNAGGGQDHENRAPYLAINFIISLFGLFPSPT